MATVAILDLNLSGKVHKVLYSYWLNDYEK